MPKIIEELVPFWTTRDGETARLYQGNVVDVLRRMEAQSVHMVVTSPPYWGLRDYGTGTWVGGNPKCDHVERTAEQQHKSSTLGPSAAQRAKGDLSKILPADNAAFKAQARQYATKCGKCGAKRVDEQLGSEKSPDCGGWARGTNCADKDWANGCHVCRMRIVFREVYRVLRDDGTLWLNYGDTYGAISHKAGDDWQGDDGMYGRKIKQFTSEGKHGLQMPKSGLKSGNLVGVPWRVALGLQADGWILRQDIIWHKLSPMPESVRNRCTKSHEYVFLLAKKMGYFYDAEAIRESSNGTWNSKKGFVDSKEKTAEKLNISASDLDKMRTQFAFNTHHDDVDKSGRNKRSVWSIASHGYAGAHFACVDDETEALTKTGWKRRDQLVDGELIAAYSMRDDLVTWQPATFYEYDFDDDMVCFDKRDTSQLLTPNHRCLVKSRKGKVKIREASSLKGTDQFMTAFPFAETPSIGVGTDMAALVGWYAAEGHMKRYGRADIYQSQTANPESVATIESILESLGAAYKKAFNWSDRYDGVDRLLVTFRIRGKVARDLMDICPGKTKTITDEIVGWPAHDLAAFLDAFVAGDGHRRLDDGRITIIQKSRHTIDQLQIIALKLGYRANVSPRTDGMHTLYLTHGRWLNIRGTNGKWVGTTQHYTGKVWCPSVPSGLWVARRNGKPFVTGNTFPVSLITPPILAGTSEKGCCADCGAPWKRIVEEKQLTRDRPNDYVKRKGEEGTGNSCANTVAGVETKTIGWEPTCECHGSFETTTKKKVHYGGWNADLDDKNVHWKKGHLYDKSKEVEVEVEEYVSDLPLEEHPVVPCTVLDPFIGSGTSICVANENGRRGVGIDLSKKYLQDNAIHRITGVLLNIPDLAAQVAAPAKKVKSGEDLL